MKRARLALPVLLVLVVLVGPGCATAPPPAPLPPEPTPTEPAEAPPPAPPPPPPCTAFARPGVLKRQAVNRAVDGGLGRWLSGVKVDASVQKGRFHGWVIRSLYPDDPCYREVDLRPGDVVVRVNGKSVERPEQANEVFLSLRSAPELLVELLRGGAPIKLSFPIAEE